jgi:hypothetical protein
MTAEESKKYQSELIASAIGALIDFIGEYTR